MATELETLLAWADRQGLELKPLPLDRIGYGKIGYTLDDSEDILIGLSLRDCNLTNLHFLESFPNLTHLNVSENPIEEAQSLVQLTNLTHLWLLSNQLNDLTPLANLTNLTSLTLSVNQLNDLAPLANLTSLTSLGLSGNQLNDLAPLANLTSLTFLILAGNLLSDLAPLANLTSLTDLYLINNQLNDLAPLTNLTSLTFLSIIGSQLHDLTPLANLTSLTKLYLIDTPLSDLAPLANLTSLTKLYLAGNQLSDLVPLTNLTGLTSLDLSNNQLSYLPASIEALPKLNNLQLGHNQITTLSPALFEAMALLWEEETRRQGLNLYNNPLASPPAELVQQGKKEVLDYFSALGRDPQRLNEIKILLVGEGEAGKTSLVKRILDDEFNAHEPQTDGINIARWPVSVAGTDITARIWDFGGQEIMHATHQFFLSKRSLYILVLDGRRDERPDYWLKHIESFGGTSPILVVLNKLDENPGYEVDRRSLQRKYPGILSFHRVSCATREGIDAFVADLQRALLEVDLLNTTWPKAWLAVKEKLETMPEPYIHYDEYEALCVEAGIDYASSQETLLDFLDALGVVVHFEELALADTQILDPAWVTQGVYKIINSKLLADNQGVLRLSDLDTILHHGPEDRYRYPRTKYHYLIELMKEFELCYAIDDDTILIPNLLPVQEPALTFDEAKSWRFIMAYDFLPPAVIFRLIVRLHGDIQAGQMWRSGMVLHDAASGTEALIRADAEANQIQVYLNGQLKAQYLAVIRAKLLEINRTFSASIGPKEQLPCPCRVCTDQPDAYYFNYADLVTWRLKGKTHIPCMRSAEDIDLHDLLNGVDPKADDTLGEILRLLQELQAQTDPDKREPVINRLDRIVQLEPNVFGLGINLNELIKEGLSWFDRGKRHPRLPSRQDDIEP